MKIIITILLSIIILSSCHKSANTNPQDYPHLSSAQIWDSIGFKYEKKYWLSGSSSGGNFTGDTIIVHLNNTVTEIFHTSSITYPFNYRAIDTVLFDTTTNGIVNDREIRLYFNKITDTITGYYLHHAFIMNDCYMQKVTGVLDFEEPGYGISYSTN